MSYIRRNISIPDGLCSHCALLISKVAVITSKYHFTYLVGENHPNWWRWTLTLCRAITIVYIIEPYFQRNVKGLHWLKPQPRWELFLNSIVEPYFLYPILYTHWPIQIPVAKIPADNLGSSSRMDGGASRLIVKSLICVQFMGIVMEVGPDVKNFKAGDRVVACFDLGCGQWVSTLAQYHKYTTHTVWSHAWLLGHYIIL